MIYGWKCTICTTCSFWKEKKKSNRCPYCHYQVKESAVEQWPPPGCGWRCSCHEGAGGTSCAELSSFAGAAHGACAAACGTARPAVAAVAGASTAPGSSVDETSLLPEETQTPANRHMRNCSCDSHSQLILYFFFAHSFCYSSRYGLEIRLFTFSPVSVWTLETLLFSVSCLKDRKAAKGVLAGTA